MSEVPGLYDDISRYVDEAYEIYDPDAEVTDIQLRLFFEKCEELHSPVDLDASILEWRKTGEVFLTDDEVVALTSLSSADFYYIFGSRVYLDADESLINPEKRVRLSVFTQKESPFGRLLMIIRSQQYEVNHDPNTKVRLPYYREKDEVSDKALLKSFAEVVAQFTDQLPPAVLPRRVETSESSDVPRNVIEELKERRTFTQAGWLRAMTILGMIEILKELGLTSTSDLNF